MLKKIKGFFAFNIDFPHVADVEKPGGAAGGEMFLNDIGILNRHCPAAEIYDPGAQRDMAAIKGCFIHGNLEILSATPLFINAGGKDIL